MKKNILFMMTLLLSTLWAQAARDWNPPSGNQYPSHAVVYATLFDASGQEVDNVADMRVGAFIDGECRAAANPVVRETPNGGRYIYTLRIGVNDADKGKKVQFVLHDPSENEYVLPETITVTGGDETVGGVPSNPFHLTFTPITAINGPSELHVNMGETVNLREKFSFEPEGASLPEVLPWVKDTCSSFTIVNDVLTPVRTGSWAYFDLSISGCWHRTELFIHQPITGLAINDTDYPGGVITVPVNEDVMLNRALENILIIRPANATEKVKWTPSDPTAIVDAQGGVWWNPVKPGTYTMTATAPGVDPVTVTVNLYNPLIDINIQSDIDVAGFVSGTLYAEDANGQEMARVRIPEFYIRPDGSTHVCICKYAEGVDASAYDQVVAVPQLSDIMRRIPKTVRFAAEARADASREGTMELGKSYTIQPAYSIMAPLAFDEGARIVYNDTIDGWTDDLEDIDLMAGSAIELTANVENKIPAYLTVSATAIDVHGKPIPENRIKVEVSNVINASEDGKTPVVTPLKIRLTEGDPGSVALVDGLTFRIEAASGEEGAKSIVGQTINAYNHTLKARDIKVRLVGKIIVNKD